MESTAAIALPLARRDLQIVPIENRGRQDWTVKDPVALRYFQLRDEERFILNLLDGRLPLDEIIARFERRFAPRRLRRSELAAFLALLHREGLVNTTAPGQGEHLLARASAQHQWSSLKAVSNILAIRLPGVNPDRWLSAAAPYVAWAFTPSCLSLFSALIVAAVAIVAVNFGPLIERMPQLTEFFGLHNLLWLAASLAIVKSLHELGHAATCKRFGGECNRMGIMLLVFTPALYCDVSDAWTFRERWKRMAVSAAGVAVELVLAALATLVWSMTQPGWVNALALNVMFVCSVSTLLINGNPLLRYDGYYVLADWLGTPNLQQQASAALRRGLAWLLAGIRLDQPRFLAEPRAAVLWGYAVLSLVYRVIVLVGIVWFLDRMLRPRGLGAVSMLIAIIVVTSVVAGPVARATGFLKNPSLRQQFNGRWMLIACLILAGVLATALLIPLPSRVSAPVVLRAENGRQIYVSTAGRLISAKPAGSRVTAGEVVAQLRNRQLELEVAKLASGAAQQRMVVAHLALRQHHDPALGDQLPAAEAQLRDLSDQLAELRGELARLELVAPAAGTVLPPPRATQTRDIDLGSFVGIPQEPRNLGCFLQTGVLFCSIGDRERLEAVAIVDQADVRELQSGQAVRLSLRQVPGRILRGRVLEVARLTSDDLPPEVLAERMIPLHATASGKLQPLQPYYQAIISLEPYHEPLLAGGVGWAHIKVAPQPLWLRGYRSLRGTLRTPW
jgi:putative peptide zinc metalloprotease protein